MTDLLQAQLETLRRRLARLIWLHGLSRVLMLLLGGALLAGLLDWWLRWDHPLWRLMLGVSILGAACAAAWRDLAGPLRRRLSDVELAQRVERRFPALQDSLASSVEFQAARNDPRIGSSALQQSVVQQTAARLESLDLVDVINAAPVRRTVCWAALVTAAVGMICSTHWPQARIAWQRLTVPFGSAAWPRRVELRLLDASLQPLGSSLRLAQGRTFEVFIENSNGPLPEDLEVFFERLDGRSDPQFAPERRTESLSAEQRVRITTLQDSAGRRREVAAAAIPGVRHSFRFRAAGGDHRDLPWHTVEVVLPPLVESLAVVLQPPEYTRRFREELPEGVGHVEALVGTEVRISARTNKPLESVLIRIKDWEPLPAQLSADGRHFQAAFPIREAGLYGYWFEMHDREGFEDTAPPRYEIRALADLAPEVAIERPPDDLQVTPAASIPLRVVAKDDLGVRDVRLRYTPGDTDPGSGRLLVRQETPAEAPRPQQFAAEYRWELSPLRLPSGTRIVYYAEATDEYNLGPEHVGRSVSRMLTVVSPEEKLAELSDRQGDLLDELRRVLELQRRSRDQIGEVLVQWQAVKQLRPEDLDLLKRVELDQRQIASRLLGPADSVMARSERLLEELADNRLDDPVSVHRLARIRSELALCGEEHLPAIERELTAARKAVQAAADTASMDLAATTRSFTEAHAHQSAAVQSLESLVELLSRWRHRRELSTTLDGIIGGQQQLAAETARIGGEHPGKSFSALPAQYQAELMKLAERQRRQADALERFQQETEAAAAEAGTPATDLLADVVREIRERLTAGKMRDAAREIGGNRSGQAGELQQEVLHDLAEIRKVLSDEPARDLESLLKDLRQAERELQQLRPLQQDLVEKSAEALQDSAVAPQEQWDRWAAEQQQLREEAERLSRRLNRSQADRAARTVGRAAAQMQQAVERLRKKSKEAAAAQDEAARDLEQAHRELAERRREVEEQLARELLEKLADQLQGLAARQQQVIDETRRLEELRVSRGTWSRAQLKSLVDLARIQQDLRQDTDRLAAALEAAEVFAVAVRGAAQWMQLAADRLEQRWTDADTVAAEQAALDRMAALSAALEQPEPADGQTAATTGGRGSGGPEAERISQLAQLKVLKSLQEDLNRRTAEFARTHEGRDELTPDEQQQAEQLALQQSQLADLTQNLTRAIQEAFDLPSESQPIPE